MAAADRRDGARCARRRTGVCRDFAHLGVALCRALSIPARYAFGYLPDIGVPAPDAPMEFCAWMELFLGGRWWTFDPRNGTPRVGRVLAVADEVAIVHAVTSAFPNTPAPASAAIFSAE